MRFRNASFVALATCALLGTVAVPAQAAPVAPRTYTAPIEAYAPYSPQATCSPTAKPGVVAFRDQVLRTYSWTRSLGIVRACDVGGRSEHKEGRAWDWGVNAGSARDAAAVRDLFAWLLATDKYGNRHAMMRRLGIQYIIWNRQILSSYNISAGWRAYTGASPHTDHVHISFSWPGANRVTSYWDGTVANVGASAPTTGGGGTDGNVPMPNDDAVGEPLPPSSLLQSTTPTTDERMWFDATRPTGVTSRTSLQRGTPYMVEVRGQYSFRTAAYADAECSRASGSTTWERSRSLLSTERDADHLDVYLNGIDGRFVSDGPDQCDAANHTYRWTYVPERTGRANFRIWDTNFRDNRGGLNIRIAKLSTDDSDTQWMAYGAEPIGNTGLVRYRDGVDYVVEVRGVYQYGAGGSYPADAECVPVGGSGWRRSYANGSDVIGVLLNGDDLSGQTLVDNGARCDETTHTYRYLWSPRRDTTLTVKLHDTRYTDNSGRLQVRVVRSDLAGRLPAPPPLPPEVLSVDSRDDNGVPTSRSYAGGTTYELTVAGVYDAGAGVSADAECTATTSDPTWRDRRSSTLSSRLLWDVTVNGRTQDWVPVSGSGPCSATHEYKVLHRQDSSGPIRVGVRDVTFADNSGAVSVTIKPV